MCTHDYPAGLEFPLRSDDIYTAIANGYTRYEICHLIAKGMRKMHRSGTRTEDSINEVLALIGPKPGLIVAPK